MPTLESLGGAMPSGSPRNVPIDENNQATALGYWFKDAESKPQPYSKYHEEYIWPSGEVRGAMGRVESYGAINIGQFTKSAFYLNVIDLVQESGDEYFDVVLETSYDQGNTWDRFARFKTIDVAGQSRQILIPDASGYSGILIDADDNDPESGEIRTEFLGDRVRAAATFTDPAGVLSSGVFSVYGIFKG